MISAARRSAFCIPLAATLLMTVPDYCLSNPVDEKQIEKTRLLEMIRQQRQQLEEQQRTLQEQEENFRKYQQQMQRELAGQKRRMEELLSKLTSDQPEAGTSPKPAVQVSQQTAGKPESSPPAITVHPIQPVGTPPPEDSEAKRPLDISSIFDQPGVLTPKGSLNVEPSFLYSHSSSDRIALVGYTIIPAITKVLIDVRRITRDTFVGSVTGRYGITNRIEVEGRIPYVYRNESASTAPFATPTDITDSSADGYGIGDIDFGIRYQLNRQEIGGPSFLASLRVKTDSGTGPFDVSYNPRTHLYDESPTGSGFWGIQPGLTAIFPTDPAVFFGSLNYMWNIEKDIGTVDNNDYGDFDPGDSFGFSFGMGLAINDKASFSLGYDHTIIMKNRVNGETPAGELNTHVGTLLVGYSYLVRDDLSLIFSLGAGVTEAAPDVQLTIKAPCNLF